MSMLAALTAFSASVTCLGQSMSSKLMPLGKESLTILVGLKWKSASREEQKVTFFLVSVGLEKTIAIVHKMECVEVGQVQRIGNSIGRIVQELVQVAFEIIPQCTKETAISIAGVEGLAMSNS